MLKNLKILRSGRYAVPVCDGEAFVEVRFGEESVLGVRPSGRPGYFADITGEEAITIMALLWALAVADFGERLGRRADRRILEGFALLRTGRGAISSLLGRHPETGGS